jgi:hypothetical protein
VVLEALLVALVALVALVVARSSRLGLVLAGRWALVPVQAIDLGLVVLQDLEGQVALKVRDVVATWILWLRWMILRSRCEASY